MIKIFPAVIQRETESVSKRDAPIAMPVLGIGTNTVEDSTPTRKTRADTATQMPGVHAETRQFCYICV